MAVYTSISESIRNATEETDTTNMLDTTAIVGPLAPAFSAALNEVFSKMPSTVDGSTGTDLVTESQQISSVQARKLVDSIPREFGKSAPVGGLNTTIYAVRRGGITPNDVTNIGDRLCNIARSPYYDADANRAPMVVVLELTPVVKSRVIPTRSMKDWHWQWNRCVPRSTSLWWDHCLLH